MPDDLMSVRAFARACNVAPHSVTRWIEKGEIIPIYPTVHGVPDVTRPLIPSSRVVDFAGRAGSRGRPPTNRYPLRKVLIALGVLQENTRKPVTPSNLWALIQPEANLIQIGYELRTAERLGYVCKTGESWSLTADGWDRLKRDEP